MYAIRSYYVPQSLDETWDITGLEQRLQADFALDLPIAQWLEEDNKLFEELLRERIVITSYSIHYTKLYDQLIFSALASSYAVLTEDEKELGVCVVDIGGGTMDRAVFTGGALRFTKVIPYAGNAVTSDIAYAFGTPLV